MSRIHPDSIKNTQLAKILAASTDDYYEYEMKDFLEIFCREVERLVLEGKVVELFDFGKFLPRTNKSKRMYSKIHKQWYDTEPSRTMQFKTSETFQKRLKHTSRKLGIDP